MPLALTSSLLLSLLLLLTLPTASLASMAYNNLFASLIPIKPSASPILRLELRTYAPTDSTCSGSPATRFVLPWFNPEFASTVTGTCLDTGLASTRTTCSQCLDFLSSAVGTAVSWTTTDCTGAPTLNVTVPSACTGSPPRRYVWNAFEPSDMLLVADQASSACAGRLLNSSVVYTADADRTCQVDALGNRFRVTRAINGLRVRRYPAGATSCSGTSTTEYLNYDLQGKCGGLTNGESRTWRFPFATPNLLPTQSPSPAPTPSPPTASPVPTTPAPVAVPKATFVSYLSVGDPHYSWTMDRFFEDGDNIGLLPGETRTSLLDPLTNNAVPAARSGHDGLSTCQFACVDYPYLDVRPSDEDDVAVRVTATTGYFPQCDFASVNQAMRVTLSRKGVTTTYNFTVQSSPQLVGMASAYATQSTPHWNVSQSGSLTAFPPIVCTPNPPNVLNPWIDTGTSCTNPTSVLTQRFTWGRGGAQLCSLNVTVHVVQNGKAPSDTTSYSFINLHFACGYRGTIQADMFRPDLGDASWCMNTADLSSLNPGGSPPSCALGPPPPGFCFSQGGRRRLAENRRALRIMPAACQALRPEFRAACRFDVESMNSTSAALAHAEAQSAVDTAALLRARTINVLVSGGDALASIVGLVPSVVVGLVAVVLCS